MAPTIFIKFSRFIAYSKPNNMTLSAFPGKFRETGKLFLIHNQSPNVAPKPTGRSLIFDTEGPPANIFSSFFRFRSTPKIKGNSHKKKI